MRTSVPFEPGHQMVTLLANCRQSLMSNAAGIDRYKREEKLAYQMIAERENQKVKIERESSLLIVAKARIWASEGWQVVITDAGGKSFAPAEFDRLLAA